MYAMFENMERRPLMLSTDDIDLFYEWFAAFYAILDQCFYLEEKCLYAWIEGADQLSEEERKWNPAPNKIEGSLSPAARTKRRGEILRLGFDIRSYRSRFEGRPVLQTLPALADAVDRFVNELVVYLDMKKDLLPSHISSNFNVKHRTKFEKNYWSTAKNMEGPALTIVAATRWMNRRQLRRLKAKYFPSGKYVYSKWNATYFTTHRAIIVEFENRVTQSEAERENQVMLNNMARARAVTDVTDETTETDRQEHQPISRGGSCRSVSYTEYSQGSFHEMVEGNATLPVLGM